MCDFRLLWIQFATDLFISHLTALVRQVSITIHRKVSVEYRDLGENDKIVSKHLKLMGC